MTQNNASREAFENWHDSLFDVSASTAVKTEYGYPQNSYIQMRWQAWQASRELACSRIAEFRQENTTKSAGEEVMKWQPIETAERLHQIYRWGYDADVGQYNMHWRDDVGSWCYSWNQKPCKPTLWMPLLNPLEKK